MPAAAQAGAGVVELPGGMGALARHLHAAVLDALTGTLTTPRLKDEARADPKGLKPEAGGKRLFCNDLGCTDCVHGI